ncbi:NAD(P)-binding domain-containing protein, partial [Enterococcus faecium]|uniref:NAD(P)-binding domain-containing protein n=2 Tax=Bacilli TaxID=91061 RepID=UPI003C6CDE4B
MKIGMIGTGNMGRILAEALIDGNAVSPSSMIVTNRTLMKAAELKKAYPGIT